MLNTLADTPGIEDEKNDVIVITTKSYHHSSRKLNVGIGPPLSRSGYPGRSSRTAACRAPGSSLPDPVTGSNGAPA
jgi:hypothetical protein